MKKDNFNAKFREYARTLSPQQSERDFIRKIYQSFNDLLGINNCIQIGSYPRFTAIQPVHDLDILYVLGDWDENSCNPSTTLGQLHNKIEQEYENPTNYEIETSTQTHSVTVSYTQNGEKIFSVDIVPAYIFSRHEFNDDTYKVPEIILVGRGKKRTEFYERTSAENKETRWITSDPRGYIKVATETDKSSSGEFRKTVKVIKKWRNNLEDADKTLKLKSFHLEQIITRFFQNDPQTEIFDSIFKFFTELPEIIDNPYQIRDRANHDRFIDDYLADFTEEQKEKIIQARDYFLIKLEKFNKNFKISDLVSPCFYRRNESEEFLFDANIPTLIDESLNFKIDGFIKKKHGYRDGFLSKVNHQIAKNREINFMITSDIDKDYTKWKVQNDKNSPEIKSANCVRGEITKNSTLNNPERTQYKGSHFVECYAIRDEECVARSKIHVKII